MKAIALGESSPIDPIEDDVNELLWEMLVTVEYLQNSSELSSVMPYNPLDVTKWAKDEFEIIGSGAEQIANQIGIETILVCQPELAPQIVRKGVSSKAVIKGIKRHWENTLIYECSVCSTFKCSTQVELDHHMAEPHYRDAKMRTISCVVCPFVTQSKNKFGDHMNKAHGRRANVDLAPVKHYCPNCDFEVRCSKAFDLHNNVIFDI